MFWLSKEGWFSITCSSQTHLVNPVRWSEHFPSRDLHVFDLDSVVDDCTYLFIPMEDGKVTGILG